MEAAETGKERLKAQARLLHVQGKSVADISRELGVPMTTLKRWKAEGGWAEGRRKARDVTDRVRLLFEEQLAFVEGMKPEERATAQMEALKKLSGVLECLEKMGRHGAGGGEAPETGGLSDEAAGEIRGRILGVS